MTPYYERFFGVQELPLDAVMPATAQAIAECITGGLTAAAILWGLRNILVKKEPQLFVLMLVGLFAVMMEVHVIPFWRFFYPLIGQNTLYSALGPQAIPVFTAFVYSLYFGWSTHLYLKFTDGSWSAAGFVKAVLAITLCEAIMEIVFIHYGLWAYYDDQPFTLLGFPIHVAFSAACFTMLYAEVVRAWFAYVKGPAQYLMLMLGPMIILGLFTCYVYPVYFAFESEGALAAARVGSVISMSIGLIATIAGIKAMARIPR